MRLYELPYFYRQWAERVEAAGGEVTAELASELARLNSALEEKSDAIVALTRELDAEAKAWRAEAADFAAKARAAESRRDALKNCLLDTMRLAGVMKVEGRRFAVARALAGVPSIRWTSHADIPEAFRRVVVELDGKAAHEAHTAGTLPKGFEVTHSEFLRIK